MELAASVEPLNSPLAPFLTPADLEFFRFCQSEYEERQRDNNSELRWSVSLTNPRNRLNAWKATVDRRWRIDGCAGLGRQLFAVPLFMGPNLPVKRIDVILPCPSRYSPALRRFLRSSCLFSMFSPAINHLEICEYVIQALDYWSSKQLYFQEIYHQLPFGSKIIVEKLALNIENSTLRFLPNTRFGEQLLSAKALQKLWGISTLAWPDVIALEELQHRVQLNGNVSVVQLPHKSEPFIFKTNTRSMKHVYHELKILLMLEDHPHIISKPCFVVTVQDQENSPSKIVGFLLEFHSFGNLRDAIESGCEISKELKMKWARQIVQTLLDIVQSPAGFYSDLKPDNIIFSRSNRNIIIIDFEQAGNWDTFQPPEIFYLNWMDRLSGMKSVSFGKREQYKALVQANIPEPADKSLLYSNPEHGYYDQWTSLTRFQKEAAMVYSFGKILWCIFEECSHTCNSSDEKYEAKVDLQFPSFLKTPTTIRDLIKKCTLGAPEWAPREEIRIAYEGSVFLPVSALGKGGVETEISPQEAVDAAKLLWTHRVAKMEDYVKAKTRWIQGNPETGDEALLGYPSRPNLTEVVLILQEEGVDEK
ncbi:MAG: hypothetical protein M1814_000946 [Vezdaea aestivalis]|nr:MAG: hypothetical protein M1814_000946 [Vezdaea aestivalis]